ncbi:MAG: hypothetical protein JST89_16465 [Cyanobacteria bacterium SZAS-4]|nr:hypothetical protein [Cyanobacteria bacterium SZAS-4]
MNWIETANDVSQNLSEKRILLSDALIVSIGIFGSRVPEIVSRWLNREITGYDLDDLNYFAKRKFDCEIANRIVSGTWIQCSRYEAALPINENPKGLNSFVQEGIQNIEVYFSEYFDINILRSGDDALVDKIAFQSGFCHREFYIVDARYPYHRYRFAGSEMLKVYRSVARSLLEVLRIAMLSLTGKGLLIP